MASSSKKKTTFAKMNRENAVRERRLRKQAKKDARKLAAAQPEAQSDIDTGEDGSVATAEDQSVATGEDRSVAS